MRMRRKKNLGTRFERNEYVVLQKSTDIYRLPEEDRYDVQDLKEMFHNDNPVELEIGCGKGTFVTTKAERNPNVNYIGVEIIDNVIISAAETAKAKNLPNVRFFNCGAEILQYLLPKNSISNIYLNFSCPYPKKQYENHRLTYSYFLEIYKFLLVDGGLIKQKTDNDGFFEFSKQSFLENGFEIFDVTDDLYKNLPSDNIATEYEQKFASVGKNIHALSARRK